MFASICRPVSEHTFIITQQQWTLPSLVAGGAYIIISQVNIEITDNKDPIRVAGRGGLR